MLSLCVGRFIPTGATSRIGDTPSPQFPHIPLEVRGRGQEGTGKDMFKSLEEKKYRVAILAG